MEKIRLDMVDISQLNGEDKYAKFIELSLIEKQIKDYKEELASKIKPSIKRRNNKQYENDKGTISYYDAYEREQVNKTNLIDKFGYDAIKDCLSIINVSDRLVVKEK